MFEAVAECAWGRDQLAPVPDAVQQMLASKCTKEGLLHMIKLKCAVKLRPQLQAYQLTRDSHVNATFHH